jgi:hypothetical protein
VREIWSASATPVLSLLLMFTTRSRTHPARCARRDVAMTAFCHESTGHASASESPPNIFSSSRIDASQAVGDFVTRLLAVVWNVRAAREMLTATVSRLLIGSQAVAPPIASV